MKTFFLKITLLGTLVVIFFSVIEIGLFLFPNDYSFKIKTLEDKRDDINIIILGASHSLNCIDPHELGDSAFNAGLSGKPYYYDVKLACRFIPKMKNLKFILMTLAPFQQYRSYQYYNPKDVLGEMESTIRCMHLKYMGIHYQDGDWQYWSEILNSKLNTIGRFYNNSVLCDIKGFLPFEKKSRSNNWMYHQLNDPIDFSNSNIMKAYSENLALMTDLVSLCKEYKVTPIFVHIPYYVTAREQMPQRDLDSLHSMINELKKTNADIVFHSYYDDSRFDENDFYNSTHLNTYGSRRLSRMIYNELIRN